MGYMGLESSVDSDLAADLMATIEDSLVAILKKALKEPGNEFNTPGHINVAFVFKELINQTELFADPSDEIMKIAHTVDHRITEDLTDMRTSSDEWDEPGRKYHIHHYQELRKHVRRFIKDL